MATRDETWAYRVIAVLSDGEDYLGILDGVTREDVVSAADTFIRSRLVGTAPGRMGRCAVSILEQEGRRMAERTDEDE